MDEDEKKPNEINPIRSVGCVVGYFYCWFIYISIFRLGFLGLN